MVRECQIFDSLSGKPVFGANYYVTAYEVGATVASASSGDTADVDAGHGFEANDKGIVGTDPTRYFQVGSVTSNSLTFAGGQTVSLAAGETLVNLGPDTGFTEPNYDGSGAVVYSDMDYGNVLVNSTIQLDDKGKGIYYHKGIAIWELVREDASTPLAINQDVSEAEDGIESFATAGAGTEDSPWTGWESGYREGKQNKFGPGWFATADASLGITLTNEPTLTTITGEGAGVTFIVITGATGRLRVYASGSGTRVLRNMKVGGFTVVAGSNNTSAGIVTFENFDHGSWVDDITIDPTSAYNISVGYKFLNCENMSVGSLYGYGWSSVIGAAGHTETGCLITTDDGIQRGNIGFDVLNLTNVTTGLNINSTTGGGSLNNIRFSMLKLVNGTLKDGTLGVNLASNCEQITFVDLQIEKFENGIRNDRSEQMKIINSVFGSVRNEANSAGDAILVNDGDGGEILSPRFSDCYNCVRYTGTTTRYSFTRGVVATSGTLYTDSSSGSNEMRTGAVVNSAASFASTVAVAGAATFSAAATVGTTLGVTGNATFSANVIRSVQAGITASTTQTQGQGPLTKDINEISVCANANDTVTMPAAVAGLTITIINNGAQTLKIFPASGDQFSGSAADAAVTLATTANVRYTAINATLWEAI